MADKKDDTTRQRLNWATAQEWAFRLKWLVLPVIPEELEATTEMLKAIIAEMLREEVN